MDGWVVIGECYVKPIDWEELWVVAPEGAGYVCHRYHTQGGQKILIGTAPTPRAAAKLALDAVHRAVGAVVNHDEARIAHGLPPRESDLMPSPAVRRRGRPAVARPGTVFAGGGGGGSSAQMSADYLAARVSFARVED